MTRSTAAFALLLLVLLIAPAGASAGSGPSEAGAVWALEQPLPPVAGEHAAAVPIGLGAVGDIEFWAPNRGLLITAGNGATIPPGVWAYNGAGWREIAKVCGAIEGSIAWAGPDDFWTVSDGRAGQVSESSGSIYEQRVPLEDNTLCHFDDGHVVGSYAHPAFEADSYQAMHAAACAPPSPPETVSSDCWFAGDPLPAPAIGSFHLHWNGSALEAAPYAGEAYPVEQIVPFEGALYESVRVEGAGQVARPPTLHLIEPGAVPPVAPEAQELPLYGSGAEHTSALDFLHLASVEGALWGAAGKSAKLLSGGEEAGQVTVVRRVGNGGWSQLIGPGYPPERVPPHPLGAVLENSGEEQRLLGGEAKLATVGAFAVEPQSEQAWLALQAPAGSGEGASAVLVHISATGEVLGEQTLPSARERAEGVGPKGAAARIACPAVEDCWMVTTQGWLYHLAPAAQRTLAASEMSGFTELITYRPEDQGLPQVAADAPPPNTSNEYVEPFNYGEGNFAEHKAPTEGKVRLPLLSHVHSRLVKGTTTLELSFHLAVKARLRLLGKRGRRVVAATEQTTLNAGNRRLLLRLSRRAWPTKLDLQTHALAPLPLVSSVTGEGANVTTETTGLTVLPRTLAWNELGKLP